ncbi:MAG: hypothetical protein BRD32_02840 [Bacteroidetes bacterium QH_2_64_74]|nr:MAG: hypothetical protein BRD32_02840 [Bacteroidetes bacterium QH_2_64_74]
MTASPSCPKRAMLVGALFLCAALSAAPPATAQTPMVLPRIDGPITVDGQVTEPAWQEIEPLPMTMYQPTYEGSVQERTEIRVAYDDKYLYVSGRLYDSNPEGIRANSLYRDRYSGDDTFAIVLDTFNDNENALWFFTTPTGVRFDFAVSNDAEGGFGGAVNDNWDTFWSAEATLTDEGWFAEMRIPLSSLGFQSDEDQVTMGMSTYRYIARRNERYVFPSIPPNWGLGFAKPSQARDVVLNNVESQRPVYVTPYVLGGVEQEAQRASDGYRQQRDLTRELGGDLKYDAVLAVFPREAPVFPGAGQHLCLQHGRERPPLQQPLHRPRRWPTSSHLGRGPARGARGRLGRGRPQHADGRGRRAGRALREFWRGPGAPAHL